MGDDRDSSPALRDRNKLIAALPVRFQKTWSEVATSLPFCVSPFGIIRKQVAELVAAAILVATFRATPRNCFNHEGHESGANQAIGPWLLAFHGTPGQVGFKPSSKPDNRELLLRCYKPHKQ